MEKRENLTVVAISQKSATVRIGDDMSRDYIFRGFHPDENGSKTITLNGKKIKGEWVEGGLLPYRNTIRVFTPHKWIDDEEQGEYWTEEDFRVEPETVGLWTGHTDVCGDKIYDGATVILNDEQSEIYTVEWDNETACFVIEGDGVSYSFDNVQDDEIEVIDYKWQGIEE